MTLNAHRCICQVAIFAEELDPFALSLLIGEDDTVIPLFPVLPTTPVARDTLLMVLPLSTRVVCTTSSWLQKVKLDDESNESNGIVSDMAVELCREKLLKRQD